MRLCYVANPRSIHTRRWLEFFASRGHDVHLLNVFPEQHFIGNVTVHHVSSLSPGLLNKVKIGQGLLSLAFSVGKAKQLVQDIQPDVLAAHYVALYGWLAASTAFHPLALHLWGGDIMREQGAFRFPGNRLTPRALHQADLVTAQSAYMLQLARPYMKPGAEGIVARIGVDLDQFSPDQSDRTWRHRLGLDCQAIILSPRPFRPVYNIETIVAAMPHVLARVPEARLILKDYAFNKPDGGYRSQIQVMIAERSLQDVVQIVEEIPHAEMPSLLRSADVVVSVSLSDGFSVAVLEAMACGVPLVLSRLPHIDELIVDGTNALTVPATDPVMLADAIVRVLNDEALRASMISANLDLVRTHASFQTELEKVESLYERIAS